MIFKNDNYKIMGSSQSVYVENQERFVSQNFEATKKALEKISSDYKYNSQQIKGKLRQAYAGTDRTEENKRSYINSYNWGQVRQKVNFKS
jgi:vacuolar-type H+-ATPase subunit E/Vma4